MQILDAARIYNFYLVFIKYLISGRVILTRRVLVYSNQISCARLIVLNRTTKIEENNISHIRETISCQRYLLHV